jgi:phosphatidylglycerol lysyltransferase
MSEPPKVNLRPERSALRRRLLLLLDATLFGFALWVLHRVLTQYRYQDIVHAVSTIGFRLMGLSLLLTVLGYAALIGYDYLSLRLVGQPMPIRRMWAASFVSFAVANSAPISILTGSGIRYRLFAGIGLSPKDTAKMAGANVLTYLLGLLTLAGFAFVFAPIPIPAKLHLPITSLRPFGLSFLAVAGVVLLGSSIGLKRLSVWRWRVELPTGGMVRAQVAVSLADRLLSSSAQ